MTAAVVEWVRRWLRVTQLEARVRLLEEQLRRAELAVAQMQANVSAAERVAMAGGDDAMSRVLAVLRRGR